MGEFLYYIPFALGGYLLGGVLFADLFGRLFKKDIYSGSGDKNPGTANAFKEGGFLCGLLTLICDVGKGIIPVALCLKYAGTEGGAAAEAGMALVLLGPVLGHMFPLWRHFKGGKGIAVSFGVLLGYWPQLYPAAVLAALFILFSAVIIINSDFYKTLLVYALTALSFLIYAPLPGLRAGFLLIGIFVFIRFHLSGEKREKIEVSFIWKH